MALIVCLDIDFVSAIFVSAKNTSWTFFCLFLARSRCMTKATEGFVVTVELRKILRSLKKTSQTGVEITSRKKYQYI
jgi:hypothetical protein